MKPTDAQMILVANAIAYELNLGHADIRPYIERAAERAIAIVREEKAEIHRDSAAEIERLKQSAARPNITCLSPVDKYGFRG